MQTLMFIAFNHIINSHEKISCSICGEMISGRRIPRHMLSKHGKNSDRKHKCKTCGKGFLTKQSLQDHTNVHTGKRPYMCKFCGDTFSSYGTHRMHERVKHLGSKRKRKSQGS